MKGALGSEGTAVAVLADSLLRAATSSLYRRPLLSGDLVLVSAVNPEARFNVGNAMARNRYIYCLSDAAVVVASARGSGGTWSGACENAKAGWVPLWVKQTADTDSGNVNLIARGARWTARSAAIGGRIVRTAGRRAGAGAGWRFRGRGVVGRAPSPAIPGNLEFFDLFLALLTTLTSEEPLSEADVAERLDIAKGPGEGMDQARRGRGKDRKADEARAIPRFAIGNYTRRSQTSDPERSVMAGREAVSPPVQSRLEFQDLFPAQD